jgi:hypothetical protein
MDSRSPSGRAAAFGYRLRLTRRKVELREPSRREVYPIAYAALLLFVPLTGVLFVTLRPPVAMAVGMFFAMLFLPEAIALNVPGLPDLTKRSLPPLLLLMGLAVASPRRFAAALRFRRSDWLLLLLIAAVAASGLTNSDMVRMGPRHIPGITTWDTLSNIAGTILGFVFPYLVGRAQIRDSRDLREFVTILVGSCVAYLPFIYFELRMSPQLHHMVYGYAQHSFLQTIRYGGYRPMVFTSHGLTLAMISLAGVMAAWGLVKARSRAFGLLKVPIAVVLTITHVLLKSTGAIVYAAVGLLLLLTAGKRTRLVVAGVLCAIVLSYPSLRAADEFPTTEFVEVARRINSGRAQSLEFRFDNEDILLRKARMRPWFGWSSWGRNRVYDESGKDISVTDGTWVIVYGSSGFVGFIATFGLLVSAIMTAFRASNRLRGPDSVLLGTLAWISVFCLVDLIPNAIGSDLTLYLAGCIVGAAHGLRNSGRAAMRPPARARFLASGALERTSVPPDVVVPSPVMGALPRRSPMPWT